MIAHVVARVRTQAAPVWLSVQQAGTELDGLGLPVVPDIVQRHRGPLTGLCSALDRLAGGQHGEWLLMCPCDAPFLPRGLAAALREVAASSQSGIAAVRYRGVVQPTFSLWHVSMLEPVSEAVMNEGRGGLMWMLDHLPHALLDWPEGTVSPFFNVNDAGELAEAQRLLDAGEAPD